MHMKKLMLFAINIFFVPILLHAADDDKTSNKILAAVKSGNYYVVETQLNSEYLTPDTKSTLLHHAIGAGYTGIVKLLLTHGASPAQEDANGKSPLQKVRENRTESLGTFLHSSNQPLSEFDGFTQKSTADQQYRNFCIIETALLKALKSQQQNLKNNEPC